MNYDADTPAETDKSEPVIIATVCNCERCSYYRELEMLKELNSIFNGN